MVFCGKTILALALIFVLSSHSATRAQITNAQTARPQSVDVKIILAVDASGSINRTELRLQLDGIAAAFRDKDVLRAIISGPHRRISTAMLIWSDAAYRKIPTKWHIVHNRSTAENFASEVEDFARDFGGVFSVVGGGTGIGDALAYALNMMADNKAFAARRVIDVSGDGVETPPWSKGAIELPQAREAARLSGVMVNGLAILNDNPNLDNYYRRNLIVGRGSFVMKVAQLNDYGDAIRKKLLRELQSNVIGGAPFPIPRNVPHRQIHRLAQAGRVPVDTNDYYID